MNSYNLITNLISISIYIVTIVLNIKQKGIFKSKIVLTLLCGVAAFFMKSYFAFPFFLILAVFMSFKVICEKNGVTNIKEYLKINEIKSYTIVFKLINNQEINFSASVKNFNKIKNWYDNDECVSYPLENTITSSKKGLIWGECINLSKTNIVEFSYNAVTNKDELLSPILYILTYPANGILNFMSYIKFLIGSNVVVLFVYILYEKYIHDMAIKSILLNTSILNTIVQNTISLELAATIMWAVIAFINMLTRINNPHNDFVYEAKNQMKSKFYNYVSINFLAIVIISSMALSSKF